MYRMDTMVGAINRVRDALGYNVITQSSAPTQIKTADDTNLYLIGPDGKKYDLDDADVIASIDFNDVHIVDGYDNGAVNGVVVETIYKGDHYAVLVRTAEEEDFILATDDIWNEGDLVSVIVDPSKIRLTLKGDLSKYEVE